MTTLAKIIDQSLKRFEKNPPEPVPWSKLPVCGGPFPSSELKADPKAIRANLLRQREQRGVKVSQSKLP
jgi:hypothetical protein